MQENEGDHMYYIHKDYLGSFQSVTNEDGEIVERYAFDPWGRRRNPDDWSLNDVTDNFMFDRGYTGHEHLDDFGLINMNGRVYDPFVARFLSPDPFVSNPTGTQGFNRYSYVVNNPLKFVDPSGYQHGNHPMTAPITVNYEAYNILGSGYQGGLGPQNGNHWSNEYNSLGEVGDFLFMSPKGFDKIYGEGATQTGRHLYSDERSSKLWRDGEISVAEILEDGGMYWDPISGEEVGRESYISGNTSYTNIYYTGDWVLLASFKKQAVNLHVYEAGFVSQSEFHNAFTLMENIGALGGYYVSFYSKTYQGSDGNWYVKTSATAYAPHAEKVSDKVTYFGTTEVIVGKEVVSKSNFTVPSDNNSYFITQGHTWLGNSYDALPSSGDTKLRITINYNAYQFWNGNANPVNPYRYTIIYP